MSATVLFLVLCALLAPPQGELRRAEIRFTGDTAVGTDELRQAAALELADLERRGFRRAEVDDAAFAMEEYLREQGHPFARVDYRYDPRGEVLYVTFQVLAGPRCRLAAIQVTGLAAFPRETVEALFRPEGEDTPWVATRARSAAARLAALYRQAGYAEVRIQGPEVEFSPDRREALLHLAIREGPRFLVRRLDVEDPARALPPETAARIRRRFTGRPWTRRLEVALRLALEEALQERGHADARAEVETAAGAGPGDVLLRARLQPGPRVRVAALRITGNHRTSAAFVRSRLLLQPGDPWTLSGERESFRRLFATGLFRRLRLSLQGEGEERTLQVEVEEAPAREFELAPGWGSYEKARLGLAFRDRNFLGTGRTVRLASTVSLVGWDNLAGFTDPWLLGADLELDVPFFWRRRREPAFTGEEYGLAVQLRRPLATHLSLTGSWRLRRSTVRAVSAASIAAVPLEDGRVASLALEPRWDSRNDLFNPTSGMLAFLRGEVASAALGSRLEYARASGRVAGYLPLDEEAATVLALGVRGGAMTPIGATPAIPIQERFFTGGQDSVRGFEEGELGPLDASGLPVGGETFAVLNAELRRQLWGNLHGAAFVDAGNVGFDTGDWFQGWRWTPGLGLRYLLPVGAVRLDLGVNPDRRPGEEPWVLHLAVGMAF